MTGRFAAAAVVSGNAPLVHSAVLGEAADMFGDLPAELPHSLWLVCGALAASLALALLVMGGFDEGPRNAIAETLLVVGCFAALGRRLGLR